MVNGSEPLALFPVTITECELCGVADGPLVDMISIVNGGVISAHRECGRHRGYAVLHTSPVSPIPAELVDGTAGSTLPVGHPVGARSGVEADGSAQDHHRVRGDGEPEPASDLDPCRTRTKRVCDTHSFTTPRS